MANWDTLDPAIQAWLRKQGKASQASAGTGTTSSPPGTSPPGPGGPSIVTIPGFTPNYEELIKSDADYQAYQANSQRTIEDASAARTAAIRRLAMQYGGLPSDFVDQYGDIDQQTKALAAANQYSDTANLQRSYDQGVEQFKRQLAARNALSSGDLGYGLDQASLARGQRSYDLMNQFGSAAGMAVRGFVSEVDAQRAAQIQALAQARANQYANPANRPTSAYNADYDSGLSGQYGVPVYRAADGSLWTVDAAGRPVSWSIPQQAPPTTSPAVGDISNAETYTQVQPDGSVKTVQGRPAGRLYSNRWMI